MKFVPAHSGGMAVNMNIAEKRLKPVSKRENLIGYTFIIPSIICALFLSFIPVILSLALSFTDWDMISGTSKIKFIGIRNYIDLFKDTVFQASLMNNIRFTLMTVPVMLFIGFFIAVLINKHCYGKNIFKAVYFLPYISSTVAIATVWMVLFQPSYGPINETLKSIGILNPPKWLADMKWALPSLAGIYVWQNTGYIIIVYIAALQAVPIQLYEAAEIDGANWLNKVKNVTIPMVTPTTFFLMITEIMSTFRMFDLISVVTQGKPGNSTSVLVYYLYRVSFTYYKVGYGAAITIILFIIIFLITFLQWKGRKTWVES